jgi:LPS export ABC transporter protein LptC
MVRQTQVFLTLKAHRFFRVFLFFVTLILLLAACSKAPVPVDLTSSRVEDPVMSAQNIDLLFSDSGKIQARLTSPLMNRYSGETPFLEFPKGFRVTMFDSAQQTSTTITANRGIRKENARTMEAWGNVVVRNEKKNEQLNTEHLVWDENRHRIWSDVKVKITKPDQVLNGSRMEANDTFTSYSIEQATGQMNVKQDSI